MKLISFLLLLFVAIQSLFAQHKCEKDFLKTRLRNGDMETSVLLLWFPTNVGTHSILGVCSNKTGLPLQRHCGYDRINNSGKWEKIKENIQLINCSSITKLCMEEPFEHNYIMKNGKIERFTNIWKTARMTEIGDLLEPCLKSSGLPVTRRCDYNPLMHVAQWEPLRPEMRDIYCLRETREVIITYDLNKLYQKVKKEMQEDKVDTKKVARQMTELLTTSQTMRIPADIKISSEILKTITENNKKPELLTEILNVTDIVMAENKDTIIKSEEVNASTIFLQAIDMYFHNVAEVMVPTSECKSITDGIAYKTLQRISVFYINPACSNISGVAIYNTSVHHRHQQHYDENTGHYYRFLYLNQTLDEILGEPELLLATYFPLSLWNKLKTQTESFDNQVVLTFLIFQNDFLFVNRTRMEKRPERNILEISMPNYTGELPDEVPFVITYRTSSHKSYQPPACGYWNYSTWITTGIKTEYKNISNNNLLICHSSHLTHFAAILGISFNSPPSLGDSIMLNISHDLILEYISVLGCGMSLLGLSCIWMTAMCFKSFRVESSNKVLLNMSFVLSLLMVFFLLMNLPQWTSFVDNENILHCTIMGSFLHYIVMVLFFWMLIIAVMQYQRYVKVLGYERSSNYVIKYAILAWGLPLIPVGLVAYLEPNTYMPNTESLLRNTGICYPSGNSLKYGVILPMAVVMLSNLGIFIYIFCSIRHSLGQFENRCDRKNLIIQIRVSVLLFFLLGISWIFGLLSRLESSPVFTYIFCLTSTLQGFVLFLYAIIIDKSTRTSWIVFLCCAKSYRTMDDKNQIKYINSRSRRNKRDH